MEDMPLSSNFAFVDTLLESLLFECFIRHMDHHNNNICPSHKYTGFTSDSPCQIQDDDANTTTTTFATIQFHPMILCMQFGSVARFYLQIAVRSAHKLNGQAIFDLSLNTISGLIAQLNDRILTSPEEGERGLRSSGNRGHRHFKFIPESLTSHIDLERPENSTILCDKISCPAKALSVETIEACRAAFESKVPEDTRKEIVFLLEMLEKNGLFAFGEEGAKIAEDAQGYSGYESEGDMCKPFAELYIERQTEDVPFIRSTSSDLADSIEMLTSLKALILSSTEDGINVSDYHVELLLVDPTSNLPRTLPFFTDAKKQHAKNPSAPPTATSSAGNHDEPLMTTQELVSLLEYAGYEFIQVQNRYSDTSCDINPQYVCFTDPTSGLTCQVTLDNPIGLRLRDMMHAYYDYDNYVEEFISGLQLTLDRHGRSRVHLSNYAIALMAIDFLVTNGFLHKIVVYNQSQQQQQQPIQTQQTQQPLASTSTSTVPGATLSKSQKKRAKKLRAKGKKLANEAAARENLVEVKTVSGAVRTINCAFEEQPVKDQKYLEDNMGAALVAFCRYYAFHQEKWMRSGAGVAGGTGLAEHSMAGGLSGSLEVTGTDRFLGRNYAKPVGKSIRRRKQHRRSHHEFDNSSEEELATESDDSDNGSISDNDNDSRRPASRPLITVFPRPSGMIMNTDDRGWGQLVVQDPLVPERNTTPFCNGWRLRHVCRVFEKAYLTLAEDSDEHSEDQDIDEIWGHTLELDAFHDATSRGTPEGVARLMQDIHDPILGQVGRFGVHEHH